MTVGTKVVVISLTTLLTNFTIPGFHNELEGNDEQPKIISQLRGHSIF